MPDDASEKWISLKIWTEPQTLSCSEVRCNLKLLRRDAPKDVGFFAQQMRQILVARWVAAGQMRPDSHLKNGNTRTYSICFDLLMQPTFSESAGFTLYKKTAIAASDVDGVFGKSIARLDQEFDQPVEFQFAAE